MTTNTWLIKYCLLFAFLMVHLLCASVFAQSPNFSISPVSGTQLKLHCSYNFWIILDSNTLPYNGFDSTVQFDSWSVILTHQSVNPFFTSTTNWYIKSGFLYRSYGVKPGWFWSTLLTTSNFLFTTTQNILSTQLLFTDRNGWPITFDTNTTDDGAVINSSISSLDILSWVQHATYTFLPYPCILDTNSPRLIDINTLNTTRFVEEDRFISFLLYDWQWPWIEAGIAPMTNTNNRSHYRYSWWTTTLANYVKAPTTVDNQAWVNSWSITITVACPSCSWFWGPYILSGSTLQTLAWTGATDKNQYTRDSKERGYLIGFSAPAPYEVEKLVTITIVGADNPNELGSTHTGTFMLSFNAPQDPTIDMITPVPNTTFVDTKISPLVFHFEDDWAWIDTGSIHITLPTLYSWTDILYTGHVYSWTDLIITPISGQAWLWNAWSYEVSLIPQQKFPTNTTITITGYVQDLAGNSHNTTWSFTTRPSCSFRWCNETFQVHILGGLFSWEQLFSWSALIVTGTFPDSIYPYLTWNNNEILVCGRPYLWTNLTGNIWFYDNSWETLTSLLYTENDLYISWMDGVDFILSGNVVIIQ